jgi:hypothetical protein
VGWTTFALAGGLALLIALLTVSFQSIKGGADQPGEVAAKRVGLNLDALDDLDLLEGLNPDLQDERDGKKN